MEANIQKFQLSDADFIILNHKGARIVKLILSGITIISAEQSDLGLGAGCYLMYPWISKLEKQHPLYKPVFTDGQGRPMHGLVFNAPMQFKQEIQEKSIVITIRPNPLTPPQLPDFTQVFVLEPGKLTVHLTVQGKSELPICFGYHPFLQIDQKKLSDLTIQTNLEVNLKLDDITLLPIVPFVQNILNINSTSQYDHLFKHAKNTDAFLRLIQKEGRAVEIRSSDMKYWQIYTPPDGHRIAVEPMTFIGNVYANYCQQKFGKLPTEGTFTITVKQS